MMTNYFLKLLCRSPLCRTEQQNLQQYNFNKIIQQKACISPKLKSHWNKNKKCSYCPSFFFHFFFLFPTTFSGSFSSFFSFCKNFFNSHSFGMYFFFQSLICSLIYFFNFFFFNLRSIAHFVFCLFFSFLLRPYSLLLTLYILLSKSLSLINVHILTFHNQA